MALADPARRRLAVRLRRLDGQARTAIFARSMCRNALWLLGGLVLSVGLLYLLAVLGLPAPIPGRLAVAGWLLLVSAAAAAEAFLGSWLRRPGRAGVARTVDRHACLEDRVASAWTCVRTSRDDDLARALILRAWERLRAIEPAAVFPVRSFRLLWIALLAVVVLVLVLPKDLPRGPIPILPGAGPGGPFPEEAKLVPEPAPEPEPEPAPEEPDPMPPDPVPEEEPEEAPAEQPPEPEPPPRPMKLELYPEMAVYPTDGAVPVTLRVLAPDPDPRPVAGTLFVRVDDGEWHPLPGRIEVAGGRIHDRLRGVDLRQAVPELSTGAHVVRAALRREDGADPVVSEPVEIFIEPPPDPDGGEGGGGGGEEDPPPEPPEEPEPPPPAPPPPDSGENPPEPPPAAEEPPAPAGPTVFVQPLFDEGETVRKIGPAFVFDPDAPRGEPPRERPLEESYGELRRRAEDAISRDEIPPEWRRLVRRYFELIRPR